MVRRGGQLAVLYLDLDHFKSVNDTLGHSAGDELLKAVTERMRGCLREADILARLGGDEFAIVQTGLEHPTDAARAGAAASRCGQPDALSSSTATRSWSTSASASRWRPTTAPKSTSC